MFTFVRHSICYETSVTLQEINIFMDYTSSHFRYVILSTSLLVTISTFCSRLPDLL